VRYWSFQLLLGGHSLTDNREKAGCAKPQEEIAPYSVAARKKFEWARKLNYSRNRKKIIMTIQC
jgi:hypothetical protein